jgi:hypothetical protein
MNETEKLVKAVRQLLNNIYEFGAPTGQEYIDAVETAIAPFEAPPPLGVYVSETIDSKDQVG